MAENYKISAFRDFLENCSIIDADSQGCAFTWSNKREGDENIRERLDRASCNLDWRVMYPEAEVFALPTIGSDHSPLLLTLQPDKVKRKRDFKFEAFWLENEECREVINEAWNTPCLIERDLRRSSRL